MANEFILRKGLISLGGVTLPYTGVSSTYSIGVNDYMINCTTGTFTATLPTAVGITGKSYLVKNSGTGVITVGTTSSQTIDGVTTKTLTQYQTLNIESNGSNWIISVLASSGGGGTFSGGTVTGPTTFTNGLTANTISATTYLNTPIVIQNSSNLFSSAPIAGGEGATVTNGIFFGFNAGNSATGASNSNFLGNNAGANATNASNSNFLGNNAGLNATGATISNFIGVYAGRDALDSSNSNFIGNQAGWGTPNSDFSNFIGTFVGKSATNISYSNLFGYDTGTNGFNISYSNFIGYQTGKNSLTSYSNLFGFNVGNGGTSAGSIGSNNIIIGTNITLPSGATNSMNLGGVLFGINTYSLTGATPSTGATATGRIGISVVTPTKRLHISGETANDSGLRLETLTSASPTSTGQSIGVDVNGNVVTVIGSAGTSGTSGVNGINGTGAPGGIDTSVQFRNGLIFSGSSNVSIQDNDLTFLTETTTPSIPLSGTVKIFGRTMGGRSMLAFVGPSGVDSAIQPTLARNDVMWWKPAGNSTTITATGAAALTATGTPTLANVAVTNIHTRMRRLDYLVTPASATAVAGFRSGVAQLTVGSTITNLGGFHYVCRFGPATGVATTTNRCFVGLANSTAAPTDVEPSSITNIVGCGWNAADTNIRIMHRGAAAVTNIDLGVDFPVPTADRTKVYELAMFSKPGTTQEVKWEFTDLGTGIKATGTISTNLPTTSTFLAPRGWMSAGGTSSLIGIALFNLYIETDY